jgi:hypothetical protein
MCLKLMKQQNELLEREKALIRKDDLRIGGACAKIARACGSCDWPAGSQSFRAVAVQSGL